jgi:hypothetical protein
MNVLPFRQKALQHGWNQSEIKTMGAVFAPALAHGNASRWVIGETEQGDPQVYLLGPAPDEDCVLCISRIGGRYIVEDGTGGLLSERGSLLLLAEQLRVFLCGRPVAFVARVGLLWFAGRKAAEEKIEPMLAESMDMLIQIAPLASAA